MRLTQTLSKRSKAAIAISAVLILLGASPALATELQLFRSEHEFVVVDPAEPIIETSVDGIFIDRDILITVSLSSYPGVKQLNGTFDVIVEVWNKEIYDWEPFAELSSGVEASLTPEPTVLELPFATSHPGYYRVVVEFTTTGLEME